MDKTRSLRDAVRDIHSGASLAVGGFGLAGIPLNLISEISSLDVCDLEVVSNNVGVAGGGLGLLLRTRQLRRATASYVGGNQELVRQWLKGQIELDLIPQGSLAERLRAGGAGIPAFYTSAGVGTIVADGGIPRRYGPDGSVTEVSSPKERREFEGNEYILEHGIVCDFALVRAHKGDRLGNLTYAAAARNFNPLAAMAGRITIAEVEELVAPGEIAPTDVHTPGIFVQRVVEVGPGEKQIELRTTRRRASDEASSS